MVKIIDYNVSVPAVVTDQVNIAIPTAPEKVILAELGIFIAPEFHNNRVELIANVGVAALGSVAYLLFRVFRDNQEIYYSVLGVEAGYEHFAIAALQVIDINAPAGAHGYSLYVETLNPEPAAVIGPINLSATVYAV